MGGEHQPPAFWPRSGLLHTQPGVFMGLQQPAAPVLFGGWGGTLLEISHNFLFFFSLLQPSVHSSIQPKIAFLKEKKKRERILGARL